MISIGESVEVRHRRLEQRDHLVEVTLTLNGKNHSIYLPENGTMEKEDETYLLERVSSLRWIMGVGELQVTGYPTALTILDKARSEGGALAFEEQLFANLDLTPEPDDNVAGDGQHCVFFDMGGSSIKGALFSNAQLARQHSMAWEPFQFSSIDLIEDSLEQFLRELLFERATSTVAYVGISSAGLCRNGALLASSLTQGIDFTVGSPYNPWFLKQLIQRLFPNASIELMNDGEVTALPFRKPSSPSTQPNKRVISLVMGSNLGAGYYPNNLVEGVHEIGFLPVLEEKELIDIWSGYRGIGSEVFSKKGLLWLAKKHNYPILKNMTDRDVIDQLHTDLRHGMSKSRRIFQSLGELLAPFVAYLRRYYEIDSVLLSGGILTEGVVDEMREPYQFSYMSLTNESAPPLQMLVVPGVLPEYNQVWSLALHYFSQKP